MPQEKKGVTGLPTIDMSATGENILRLRINAGLTVKQLVDIFGAITPQAVYKWQKGEALPTLDNLVVLSKVFGVPMDEIVVVAQSYSAPCILGAVTSDEEREDDDI